MSLSEPMTLAEPVAWAREPDGDRALKSACGRAKECGAQGGLENAEAHGWAGAAASAQRDGAGDRLSIAEVQVGIAAPTVKPEASFGIMGAMGRGIDPRRLPPDFVDGGKPVEQGLTNHDRPTPGG